MSLMDLFLERSLEEKSLTQNLPLPLRKGDTYQSRERIDELLGEHWSGRKAWLRSDGEEGDKKFSYGEVTPMGARQMIEIMGLETLEEHEDQDFSFQQQRILLFSTTWDLGQESLLCKCSWRMS